jgi:uncharacterized protein (DUF58 family)
MALTLQELLLRVRAIDFAAHKKSSRLLLGDYKSNLIGTGMSFREVRNYRYGDDVRNIDWNVSARMQEPFVKIFEEEKENSLLLLIDISASNLLGSRGQNKKDRIAEITAAIAFSALAKGDKVGAIFFADKVTQYFAPKKGKSNLLQILKTLVLAEYKTTATTSIEAALQLLMTTQLRRTSTFILSDFIGNDFSKKFKAASFKHNITGIHIYDILEKNLPALGLLPIKNLETQKTYWIDSSNAKVSKEYEENFTKNRDGKAQIFKQNKASWMSINTEEDYTKTLDNYFKTR